MHLELELSALMPDDESSARALLTRIFGGTRYGTRLTEQLDGVLGFDDPEYIGMVAWDGTRCVGLTMFGAVAGARAVTKLHAVVTDSDDVSASLVETVVGICEDSAERMIVAELPEDSPFAVSRAAMLGAGFTEEGRVPDYIVDGVGLSLLVRRL